MEKDHYSGITTFNPRFKFENIVVGDHNKLAVSAAKSMVETATNDFNPLYISGGHGLGKTHLLHAIGNEITEKMPQVVVRYFACQELFNSYSIISGTERHERSSELSKLIETLDVILIDDIQTLDSKLLYLPEFTPIFNKIIDSGKSVVLVNETQPGLFHGLNVAIRTKFRSGLLSQITPPDFKTRLEIVRRKAQEKNLSVSIEVLQLIASQYSMTVCEMEGALATYKANSMFCS